VPARAEAARPLAVAVALLLARSASSAAQDAQPVCSEGSGPAVVLRTTLPSSGVTGADVQKHLAAGLGPAGFRVCSGALLDPGGRASDASVVTEVHIEEVQGPGVPVRITVTDRVTTKTVQRSFELEAMPGDSRSVALAVYAEELLHASWAELALRNRPRPQRAPPPPREVVASVADELEPPGPQRFRIGVGGAAAAYSGGLLLLGPEVQAGYRPWRYLEATLRLSYRFGPTEETARGSIDTQALVAGGQLQVVFPEPLRWLELRSPHGADAVQVTFLPEAEPGTGVARSESLWAAVVSHGLAARVAFTGALAVTAEGRFQWVPRGADAGDGTERFTGISGVGGELGLSCDARF
jgi:hypothetical protein